MGQLKMGWNNPYKIPGELVYKAMYKGFNSVYDYIAGAILCWLQEKTQELFWFKVKQEHPRAPVLFQTNPYIQASSWWFQPIWNIFDNLMLSPSRGENKKSLKPPPGLSSPEIPGGYKKIMASWDEKSLVEYRLMTENRVNSCCRLVKPIWVHKTCVQGCFLTSGFRNVDEIHAILKRLCRPDVLIPVSYTSSKRPCLVQVRIGKAYL